MATTATNGSGGGGSSLPRLTNKRKHCNVWTNHVERIMIKFYKNRPYLWHPRAKGYFQKDKKDLALEQLANYLCQQTREQYTASMIRDRWSSMRSSFISNDKKVENSKDPISGHPTYFPSWPYYDELLFLRESRNARTKSSDNDGQVSPYQESSEDMEMVDDVDENHTDWLKRNVVANEPGSPPSADYRDHFQMQGGVHIAPKEEPEHAQFLPEVLSALLKDFKENTEKEHDACDSFGVVVAAALRDMTSYNRARAQMEIQKVLLQYHPENPENCT